MKFEQLSIIFSIVSCTLAVVTIAKVSALEQRQVNMYDRVVDIYKNNLTIYGMAERSQNNTYDIIDTLNDADRFSR